LSSSAYLNKYFHLLLLRLQNALTQKQLLYRLIFEQGHLKIKYPVKDRRKFFSVLTAMYKAATNTLPAAVDNRVLQNSFQKKYEPFINKKFFINVDDKKVNKLIKEGGSFQPEPLKFLIMLYKFYNRKQWVLFTDRPGLNNHPFRKIKNTTHNIYSKKDYFKYQQARIKNYKNLVYLCSVPLSLSDRFYEQSLPLAYLFNAGGRLAPYKAVQRGIREIPLNDGYYKFNKINKKITLVDGKIYFLVNVELKDKYANKRKASLCQAVLVNAVYKMQSINQPSSALVRIRQQALADLVLNYNQHIIRSICSFKEISYSDYRHQLDLIHYYDEGTFLNIASRMLTEENFVLISHPELNRDFIR